MKQLPFYLLALLLVCGCTNTNTIIQGNGLTIQKEMQYAFTSNTISK